jgi:hypothetical protein
VEEARQHPAVTQFIAASLIVAALVLFFYVARILFTGLTTGVLSIHKGAWDRSKEPKAFWYNAAVMAVFLLVPLIIAALAAFTLIG